MFKYILILLLLIIAIGCDPMDDRVSFMNNSDEDVFFDMLFIGDSTINGTYVGLRKIERGKCDTIGKIGFWEGDFNTSKKLDTLVSVVIFKNINFDTIPNRLKTIHQDRMLKKGDYEIKRYSYTELENKDWRITYPQDSFLEGKALKID